MDSLPSFKIISNDWQKYKTLISQELLKENILGSNVFYPSIKHENKITKKYIINMSRIFKLISLCENKKKNIDNILETPIAIAGFKRLN